MKKIGNPKRIMWTLEIEGHENVDKAVQLPITAFTCMYVNDVDRYIVLTEDHRYSDHLAKILHQALKHANKCKEN